MRLHGLTPALARWCGALVVALAAWAPAQA
ncbi:MAG: hypothetical protein RI936_709, partial [Pseudomonadota bacterium]